MLKLKFHYFGTRCEGGSFPRRVFGKDPDARKDLRKKDKGTTEDEMVGWHHRRDGHEFEQASGACDGQGSLECCGPWGRKESDRTE